MPSAGIASTFLRALGPASTQQRTARATQDRFVTQDHLRSIGRTDATRTYRVHGRNTEYAPAVGYAFRHRSPSAVRWVSYVSYEASFVFARPAHQPQTPTVMCIASSYQEKAIHTTCELARRFAAEDGTDAKHAPLRTIAGVVGIRSFEHGGRVEEHKHQRSEYSSVVKSLRRSQGHWQRAGTANLRCTATPPPLFGASYPGIRPLRVPDTKIAVSFPPAYDSSSARRRNTGAGGLPKTRVVEVRYDKASAAMWHTEEGRTTRDVRDGSMLDACRRGDSERIRSPWPAVAPQSRAMDSGWIQDGVS
ncbi:hypothetical protein B0H17DRAFT_1333337 [Mycena rosella]|uniref:Uncharacterized protein n=1 Tax=Mycena rosella TaxID=1033263 RepID=A0AAD7DAY1_MYCRO|nr:hypothetical protein B0H17DRAFT_1333337 [Mycena rosella]